MDAPLIQYHLAMIYLLPLHWKCWRFKDEIKYFSFGVWTGYHSLFLASEKQVESSYFLLELGLPFYLYMRYIVWSYNRANTLKFHSFLRRKLVLAPFQVISLNWSQDAPYYSINKIKM